MGVSFEIAQIVDLQFTKVERWRAGRALQLGVAEL